MRPGRFALALVLCIVACGLAGCTLDNVAARQDRASGLWDELTGGRSFGQTFVSSRDGLYRLDLGTATYARTNSAPVLFHLRPSPSSGEDLRTVTIVAAEIENERPTSIEFAPLPDSQGKSFFFYIESSGSTPGDAITVYANAQDRYAEGTAYRDGQAVGGDLVFTAYSRETFTLGGVLAEFWSRLSLDPGFLACYGVVVTGVAALFVVALVRWQKRPSSGGKEGGKEGQAGPVP